MSTKAKQLAVNILAYIVYMYAFSYYLIEILLTKHRFSTVTWVDVPTQLLVMVVVCVIPLLIPSVTKNYIH